MKTTVIYHRADFGDWKVIGGPRINQAAQRTEWLCRCKCGIERWIRSNNLKTGNSTNCGCRRSESISNRNRLKIGGVWVERGRAAHTWDRMIRRCYESKSKGFENYGGRGIKVCERWRGDQGLKNFLNDMGDPPFGHSLGRIDNDSDYSPENCRWETPEQQQSNKRTNVYGYLNGERMTAAQIGRIVGRHSSAVARHIKKGLYANNSYLP